MQDREKKLLMAAAFMASTFLANSSGVSAVWECDRQCNFDCEDQWYCEEGMCLEQCTIINGQSVGCTYTCYECAS